MITLLLAQLLDWYHFHLGYDFCVLRLLLALFLSLSPVTWTNIMWAVCVFNASLTTLLTGTHSETVRIYYLCPYFEFLAN